MDLMLSGTSAEKDKSLSELMSLALKRERVCARRATRDDASTDFFSALIGRRQPPVTSLYWSTTGRHPREDTSSSSSSSSSGGGGGIFNSLLSGSNSMDANNSGKGLDMLNMPSTAESMEKRNWIQIYFRYRVQWYQAKPYLEKMSREDAYKPENLKHWTNYVRVTLHRKAPFANAVRVFRNRVQCPGVQIRYTLNSFYRKDAERVRTPGPLHPIPLPQFRCPDDLPEFRKMAVAVTNVFVTTDNTYFDALWKECSENAK